MNLGAYQPTQPVRWLGSSIEILDQSRLPSEERYLQLGTYEEVAQAIVQMKVRGAPVIGICAAYGLALAGQILSDDSNTEFMTKLRAAADSLTATRPTAVNLFRAVSRMMEAAERQTTVSKIKEALVSEAGRIHAEESQATETMSRLGAELIPEGSAVLTHCNAGSLATGGFGTALGVIKAASRQGKLVQVIATETRPLLQGARLTAWELMREGISVTLITDSMAGYMMSQRKVSCVFVGADRIAENGDTANKIGTYCLAVLAKENGIPFYVVAPISTIDVTLKVGNEIPIELRSPEEITHIQGVRIAPEEVEAINPAFDVTPHRFISAIITERGILREPYEEAMSRILVEHGKEMPGG